MAPLLHCHRSTPAAFEVAFVVVNSMLSQFSLLLLVLIVSSEQFFLIPFYLLLLYVRLLSSLFPALLLTSRPLSPPFFSLPPSLPPHIFSFHFLYYSSVVLSIQPPLSNLKQIMKSIANFFRTEKSQEPEKEAEELQIRSRSRRRRR